MKGSGRSLSCRTASPRRPFPPVPDPRGTLVPATRCRYGGAATSTDLSWDLRMDRFVKGWQEAIVLLPAD
ncbi:hypothetical protein GCM10027591_11150 [Zhihengliuella somnathii]